MGLIFWLWGGGGGGFGSVNAKWFKTAQCIRVLDVK